MNNIILILLVLLLFVYMIVRQFTEQQVTWSTLLLLPAISAYASYTDLQPAFARFALLPLAAGLALGVLVGLITGIFRGQHTKVRLDSASGNIYSKPELASSLMWLGLLIIRIAVIALGYSPLEHNLFVGILTAFGGTLFLVSISTQKFMVYMQYNRYQMSRERPFQPQRYQ